MSVTASFAVSPKERAVQEALEARLEPSELLLSFTQCRYNPGGLVDKTYWIGLTRRRLLILRKDLPLRVYSIYPPFIKQITFKRSSWRDRGSLKLALSGETVTLATQPPFTGHSAQLARLFSSEKLSQASLSAGQVIGQVTDFFEMGMLHAAQAVLRDGCASDPAVEIDPGGAALEHLMNNMRAAMTLGAAMNGLMLAVVLGLVLVGANPLSVGAIFTLLALLVSALFLARGKQSRRGLALGLDTLVVAGNFAASIINGSLVAAAAWLVFGLALLLALTGHPNRTRMTVSGMIFLLGLVTALALGVSSVEQRTAGGQAAVFNRGARHTAGLFRRGAALKVSQTQPFTRRYFDDFSSDQGWPLHQEPDLVTQVIDGKYAISVKQPNTTFYAFPPDDFTAQVGQIAVEIPPASRATQGTFGLVCGYRPVALATTAEVVGAEGASNFYRIEIDPGQRRYTVMHFEALPEDGGREKTPVNSDWRGVTGLDADQAIERLSVRCAGNEIRVTVNQIEQAPWRLEDVEPFAEGKMGLFVSTWEDTGPQGYEILFNDVSFDEVGE